MEGLTLRAPAPLADRHLLDAFDSGAPALDDWLKRRARANQAGGASRIYVVAEETGRVVAYYALASGALASAVATGRLRRNMPDPIPMAIIGRLAVDRGFQGQGLGVAILRDAVLRTRQAAAILGIRGILVHALSEDAKRFYECHGFRAGSASPMTLVMSTADRP
ncbi:GNAT family N-acetyltransferase [Bosea sp. 124]|uniref:GNAT family N-acetyltransferase n=1 Tax=Bosea sp. 124 TaxID=2135642 RepID=UPI000D392A17|nr:GNAT family N-acetyltransferase [Bosea sp. 124]PTM43133.1 acetyltransferase (GNAT) family protein [Bosea sp. 124]